ncbi:MAG: hypothetical protein ACRCX2_28430 [Paraclostridium sp.]
MVKNYDRLFEMLPEEMKPDDNATSFKEILAIYCKHADGGDALNECYGNLLDVRNAQDEELDLVGAMFGIFRDIKGEGDEYFRYRIIRTTVARKIPTTIPELQQAIDSTVTSGKLYVFENHDNLPCNVYLTGTADEDSIRRSVDAITSFLPAGVRIVIAVVQFSTWQNIKDQYISYQSMVDLGVIW